MTPSSVGILFSVLSAIFNGSFSSLFKIRHIVDLGIHPVVFQLYVSIGVFLSSILVIPFIQIKTTTTTTTTTDQEYADDQEDKEKLLSGILMGMTAGALFVCSIYAAFTAVDYIGISLAQGIWGGVAMVISYLWGLVIFHQKPNLFGLSIFALILLIIGVLCIAFCENIGMYILRSCSRRYIGGGGGSEEREEGRLLVEPILSPSVVAATADNDTSNRTTRPTRGSILLYGILWASLVGIFGGSILAPMHYIPDDKQGLWFLPWFGLGAIVSSPFILILHTIVSSPLLSHLLSSNPSSTTTTITTTTSSNSMVSSLLVFPSFHIRQALPIGMLSGLIFNIGNLLSILAIPIVGYGVAYPILQCAILISGFWGIYMFNEISDLYSIISFWIGGVIIIIGGALLTFSR